MVLFHLLTLFLCFVRACFNISICKCEKTTTYTYFIGSFCGCGMHRTQRHTKHQQQRQNKWHRQWSLLALSRIAHKCNFKLIVMMATCQVRKSFTRTNYCIRIVASIAVDVVIVITFIISVPSFSSTQFLLSFNKVSKCVCVCVFFAAKHFNVHSIISALAISFQTHRDRFT